jgi:hypothetical protein
MAQLDEEQIWRNQMNLTQLLVTQQNVDALSQQFGLSEEQTLEAMGALLPAFSEGLKRNTASAQGAAGFIEALASGRHRHYADDPSNAMSAFGVNDGNAILGHLFGGKDTSRAVANHASAASGIGSSILKQMLPVIASMIMGSMFKGATNTAARRGNGGLGGMLGGAAGGGILGQLIEGLAGGMLSGNASPQVNRRRAPTRRQQAPTGLEDLLGELLGGGRQRTSRTQTRTRSRQTGGGIFDELLNPSARRKRQNPYTPHQQKRRPARRRSSGGGLGEIFGDMLEPGGNTSSNYQRETGSVFDQFLGPN